MFVINPCLATGECSVLPDDVRCRRRTASPRGLGLDRTLQLPTRTHPGRILCHAADCFFFFFQNAFEDINLFVVSGTGDLLMFLFLFHDQAVVDGLLSKTTDNSLLISRFQEFLEMEDVRYYVMGSVRESVGKVMDKSKGVGELCLLLNSSCLIVTFIVTI